jgi:hypothetical protein
MIVSVGGRGHNEPRMGRGRGGEGASVGLIGARMDKKDRWGSGWGVGGRTT